MSTKISDLDNARIGRIIKREREFRQLTVDALATFIGCDHSTITGYEVGRRPVPKPRVFAIAQALDLDPRLIDPKAA